MAGCRHLFSGSSKWNVCRPRNTLVVACKWLKEDYFSKDGKTAKHALLTEVGGAWRRLGK